MSVLEDIIMINKSTIKKSLKSFKKNWIIILSGFVYGLLNVVMAMVIFTFFRGVLSIFAGVLMAIASSSLISNYLYLLSNIINYDNITLDDFKEGFKHYLWKIYGVFFIGWLGSYILSLIGGLAGTNVGLLSSIISVVLLIAINPLPETIYQKHYSSFESITYAFEFMKENWLNWTIPNIIFHFLLYLITNRLLLNVFNTHLTFDFGFSIRNIVIYILGQALFSFIMIYRGHLFKLLSTSTRRKRIYMNKFYE